jgi:hypothetical protein
VLEVAAVREIGAEALEKSLNGPSITARPVYLVPIFRLIFRLMLALLAGPRPRLVRGGFETLGTPVSKASVVRLAALPLRTTEHPRDAPGIQDICISLASHCSRAPRRAWQMIKTKTHALSPPPTRQIASQCIGAEEICAGRGKFTKRDSSLTGPYIRPGLLELIDSKGSTSKFARFEMRADKHRQSQLDWRPFE